jgi:hypothetical protein
MKLARSAWVILLAVVVFFCSNVGLKAGDLEPQGPPSEGTMHTLEDIYTIVADTNSKVSSTGETYASMVEKSGQTTSYATGDDGELQRGVTLSIPRFTDNDDETVTDNLTGLMWTKDADIANGKRTWTQAISDCEACTVGNYTDWHLPQIKELQSLVNFGYFGPALSNAAGTGNWTVGDPFTDVWSSYYWSSTSHAGFPDNAWFVHLYDGRVDEADHENFTYYVWCVRGAPE